MNDANYENFGKLVKKAAAQTTERFGENKVYISDLYANYPTALRPDMDTFKAMLMAAHRAGDVVLTRADLVELMDVSKVAASEISYLTATFHLVRV